MPRPRQNAHMRFSRARHILLVGLVTTLLCAGPVYAGLGGDGASIVADSDELKGSLRRYSSPLFETQEITTDNGIRVREFLNRDGLVFAVAWSGPAEPNLRQLLGVHFVQYHQARLSQTPAQLRRAMRLALPEFVIESGGHMRAYRGRAYLPALVPDGVSIAILE